MKILVATDGSEFSKAAVEKCCRIVAEPENTAIKIVSVYQTVVPLDIHAASVEHSQEIEEATRRQAENIVIDAAAALRACFSNMNIEITTQILKGATDQAIIEAAKQWNADLIVAGSHGRGFWGRIMLGSVSDSLVHHAPCSVLVVRKPEGGQKEDE